MVGRAGKRVDNIIISCYIIILGFSEKSALSKTLDVPDMNQQNLDLNLIAALGIQDTPLARIIEKAVEFSHGTRPPESLIEEMRQRPGVLRARCATPFEMAAMYLIREYAREENYMRNMLLTFYSISTLCDCTAYTFMSDTGDQEADRKDKKELGGQYVVVENGVTMVVKPNYTFGCVNPEFRTVPLKTGGDPEVDAASASGFATRIYRRPTEIGVMLVSGSMLEGTNGLPFDLFGSMFGSPCSCKGPSPAPGASAEHDAPGSRITPENTPN